jgi:hypothetical protein
VSPEIWCRVDCLVVHSVSNGRIVFKFKSAKQRIWTVGLTWREDKGASALPILIYIRINESVRTVCILVESGRKGCMCIEE